VVAQAFVNGLILRHGVCNRINLDLVSEFTADVFKTICQHLGINHHISSVMHPTSNGEVEQTNRTLLAYIRKFIMANTVR
jgi:transposase InsO family protein